MDSVIKLEVPLSAEKARSRLPVVGQIFRKEKQKPIESKWKKIFLEQVQGIFDKWEEKGQAVG